MYYLLNSSDQDFPECLGDVAVVKQDRDAGQSLSRESYNLFWSFVIQTNIHPFWITQGQLFAFNLTRCLCESSTAK